MQKTSSRLLALLSLLQTHRDWSGDDLAERLDITSRTVRRDIDRLRDLGYRITTVKGPAGGYRLEAGTRMPPLLFDDGQAVALAVALRSAATTAVAEDALRALATVRQVLPPRLRHRIDQVRVTPVHPPTPADTPRADPEALLELSRVIHAREELRFDYPQGPGSPSADVSRRDPGAPPPDDRRAPGTSSAEGLGWSPGSPPADVFRRDLGTSPADVSRRDPGAPPLDDRRAPGTWPAEGLGWSPGSPPADVSRRDPGAPPSDDRRPPATPPAEGPRSGPHPPPPGGPRRVHPHHLVTWRDRWYLVAWDLDREDWRTFRVDRIRPRTPTGPRFTPRELPGGDLATFVTGRFRGTDGTTAEWPCRGEAVLHAPAADVAPFAPDGVVEELGPHRCRLTLGSWSWPALAAALGHFDTDFEVVGPPELAAACADLAARYTRATGRP